ncbi:NAD(P)H-quinone oxidoreductase [Nocardia terpenica]|uniref:NAD(P)H-quinone oxidoreductase n=1 Tax=Nocardia terpenica TaxID=455432 RepID=UPI001895E9C0|nr:NAD(P)H-quinone oxidoreductase [Nocardia terpenica]MBF6065039.1 NAD(P)H-quinone oxidoreductase [Nocardia terpenica]MBF6108096.1 NAD(P)H-quinone oxidoreductase [Nocardia terpenica]MBF6115311.1 NAD(P)H-quinone oxidoreductase [Nocardia terpenica]MBF6122633.1 NAD(P)H-quinone oxidoreductase [Nocardia terpenica]
MHAVILDGFGGPEVLRWAEAPDPPAPGPGEVAIDVVAAGVNRADLLQRQGFYPPPPGASEILGLECSGVIAAVGPGVTEWQPGDRVCALLSGGGYAERVVAPEGQVLPVPEGLDLVAAAALPEVAATVWSNVVMRAGLRAGQLLLIHGGGGGIGTHAIQVATALGARVAVTAGSQYKLDRCKELGASILINYREEDFVAVLGEFGGADVILDNMGAAYLERNVDTLAEDGQLCIVGMQGGVRGEVNLSALLGKRGTVHATNLRRRPATGRSSKAEIIAELRRHLWPLIADGTVVPVVHAEVPVAEAARAHELPDSAETVGKVLLRIR